MLRNLFSQFSTIVMALLFAMIVWGIATGEQNPIIDRYYTDPLPIEIVNRPEGTMVYKQTFQTVKVKLRAPQTSWDQLQPASFRAIADLNGLGSGMHQVNVQIQLTDPRVTVTSIDPPNVGVQLERVVSREFDLHPEVLDAPPIGYAIRTPVATQSKIKVSGPATQVDQVVEISADVYLRGAKSAVEREVTLQPRDAQNNVVQNVTLAPATVVITIPVEQRVGYKDVSIRAQLKGSVAAGYWISNILVAPSTVTIAGNPDALNKIPGFIETLPIDVTSATTEVTKRVTLNLPEGVTILSDSGVTVQVSVTPIMGGQTVRRSVTFQGLRRGMNVASSPDTVEVILSGPMPSLTSLGRDDVQVVIDITGSAPGVYQLKPRVPVVPDGLKVQSIVPDTVQVTIIDTVTPTPTVIITPTLVPSPTPTRFATPTPTPLK
ncbi:MAG: hypothetical protein HZB51_33225 [Chloroflexi bacterium]|nr:hypothetical protein [Chloroflexota bacterium]